MYTKLFYKLIFVSAKLFSLFGPVGMSFNLKTRKFFVTRKLRKYQLYACLSSTVQAVNFSWRMWQMHRHFTGGSHNLSLQICTAYTFIAVMALFPIWKIYVGQEDFKNVLNRVLNYSVEFQGMFLLSMCTIGKSSISAYERK